MSAEGDQLGTTPRKTTHPRGALTNRQRRFVELVISGSTNGEAYRRAYKKPKILNEDAKEHGYRVANRPAVKSELDRLRGLSDRKKLLTLNDRLEILADIAQDTAALRNDRTRAIDVYSKIAGDNAPQRIDVSVAGKDGSPIQIATTAAVMRVGVRERMAAMRAARLLAEQAALAQPGGTP